MNIVAQELPQFTFTFAKEEHVEELTELATDVWLYGNTIVKKLELSREEVRNYLGLIIKHAISVSSYGENLVVFDKQTSRMVGFNIGYDFTKRAFEMDPKILTPRLKIWLQFGRYTCSKLLANYDFKAGEAFWVSLSATHPMYHGTHLYSVMLLYGQIYLREKGYSFIFGISTHPHAIALNSGPHMVILLQESFSEFEMDGQRPLDGASKAGWIISTYLAPRSIKPTLLKALGKLSNL